MNTPVENIQSDQSDTQQCATHPVSVMTIGMITPVGADAEQTAAAIHAGISKYSISSYMNKKNNPATMALVPEAALPELDTELAKNKSLRSRQQRMLRLCTPAIQQAYLKLKTDKPVPLLLGGPHKVPGKRSPMSDEFLKDLMVQAKVPLDLDNSFVFPKGNSAGMYALEAGMMLLERGIPQVMVGAVDTYLDSNLLAALDQEDRLLAEQVMDGFAPGEAAVFLVLTKATEDDKNLKLYPPEIAAEQGHRYSQEIYKGDGLANAIRGAIKKSSATDIKTVLSNMNGESFSGKEWGVSFIRNNQHIVEQHQHIHPAEFIGDAGAAMGFVLIVLAMHGIKYGKYQRPALVWTSSDYHQRAALVLR
jgi:3-oxoacyl-[acyl-carrier-protein] synthase-1